MGNYGAEFKLDVSTLLIRSAGRLLSVIWQTRISAITRIREFVANGLNGIRVALAPLAAISAAA